MWASPGGIAGVCLGLVGSFSAMATAEDKPRAPSASAPESVPADKGTVREGGSAAKVDAGKGAEAVKAPKGPTGGYSWSEKPAPKHKKRKMSAPRADAPLVTYPGFQMLSAGASQLWVAVTRPVEVRRERKGRVLTFVLEGADVGTENNTNPLITTHFDTPMESARLVRNKDGARLTIWLREKVEPTHRIVPGPRGTIQLLVDFPKSKGRYHSDAPISVEKKAAPSASSDGASREKSGPSP